MGRARTPKTRECAVIGLIVVGAIDTYGIADALWCSLRPLDS